MYIIIAGCGKVGARLANVLSEKEHDVVVIDDDESNFGRLSPNFKGVSIIGVPIDQDVLKHAGIENCDAFAAVTPDDNTNIMASQMAQEIFKVKKVMARIYNPEREMIFHQFLLQTICPTRLTVDNIVATLVEDSEPSNVVIGNDSFSFHEILADFSMINKKVKDIFDNENEFLFGIRRNGHFKFSNNKNEVIIENDLLVIAKLI